MTRRTSFAATLVAVALAPVAVVVAPVAEGAKKKNVKPKGKARFQGSSSQKLQVKFRTTYGGRSVTGFTARYSMRCGSRRSAATLVANRSLAVKNGRFGSTGNSSVRIKGRFPTRRKATGTFRIRQQSQTGARCDSGTVKFTVKVV